MYGYTCPKCGSEENHVITYGDGYLEPLETYIVCHECCYDDYNECWKKCEKECEVKEW